MKKEIHPKYNPKAEARCACGNTFLVGSCKDKIHTEVCGACHPYYTGKAKVMDTAGRVDRFKTRLAKSAQFQQTKPKKRKAKKK